MVVILKDKTSQSDVIEMIEYLDAFNVSVSVTEAVETAIMECGEVKEAVVKAFTDQGGYLFPRST